ncbi:LysR family transcriptional regulator [Shewanella sp. TC10]|uniref:LysR family transcriptional regulator n=1 Tax=Shewanella sp. TC10 TaxID=1419739 RepID=UPI00129E58F4|nr:LysR family transcriptional regulator [Shewanella sp. TC10]
MKNDIPNFNLLAVFSQVMEDGSLSKAAENLNTNQSTVSTMLGRLKEEVGQDLFIRKGRGVVPTSYSLSLYQQIQAPINQLNGVFTSFGNFDPLSSNRRFVLTAPEHMQGVLLKQFSLIDNKGISLEVFDQMDKDDSFYEVLLQQKFDLMIDILPFEHPNVENLKLFDSEFVVICSEEHPRIQGCISEQQYMQESHAILERTRNHLYSLSHYTNLNLSKRKVSYHGRSLFSNLLVVSQSEYISVVPLSLALEFKEQLKLQLFRPPFEYKKVSNYLIWLKKLNQDPAHSWFRDELVTISSKIHNYLQDYFPE